VTRESRKSNSATLTNSDDNYSISNKSTQKLGILLKSTYFENKDNFNSWVDRSSLSLGYKRDLKNNLDNLFELEIDSFSDLLNAYVPYKDTRTLKMFLTVINYFDYEHSEKLGDAFEYLLSVMGSQGDAGQFRTPRHIIDFVVDVFEPQIGEKILDPACGTAGFLISAVKNIEERNGSLGEIEKNNIRDNLFGFDISPDMVRLALVNMFLHGFSDSNIEEFDTLSSSKKWDDRYDLILANPPFMTPKGGIEPHDLLLTECDSTKAEVLFTSYILNHLREQGEHKGRAGIIVPEGIIFQSGKAYRKLRKELLKKGLFGVVSLPAGVFNPYSGVKTSVLLIDKNITSDDFLFLKISCDGKDLGSQRRNLGHEGDLPEAKEIISNFRKGIKNENNNMFHLFSKKEILESDDSNLSGDRYKEDLNVQVSDFPMVELGDVCDIQSGFAFNSKLFNETEGFPLIRIRNIKKQHTKTLFSGGYNSDYIVDNGDFLIGMDGEFNACLWIGNKALLNQRVCKLHNFNGAIKQYIFRLIQNELKKIEEKTFAVTVKHISVKQIKSIKIPLPPLKTQQKIVEEIENYQKIIDGAKLVTENYKPKIDL
jgi:type I restriction enzyme M protein